MKGKPGRKSDVKRDQTGDEAWDDAFFPDLVEFWDEIRDEKRGKARDEKRDGIPDARRDEAMDQRRDQPRDVEREKP